MEGARSGDATFEAAVFEARLEAVRAFAYGAGHEINNPLANIAARAQALLVDERDPERRRKLATIVDQAFRARDMIGGLMVFARPPRPCLADVDLRDVLRSVVEAVRPAADAKGVRLDYDPPQGPLPVRIDAAQVGEAVRALVANAIEATDESGRVAIEAAPGEGGCRLTVIDDGPGMDGEAARMAFDPFFCGRDAGRGIGLGLPKALRLIESNGGGLTIDSRPGKGTRVAVTLPDVGGDAAIGGRGR
jgi:signal transduction histidine kinase